MSLRDRESWFILQKFWEEVKKRGNLPSIEEENILLHHQCPQEHINTRQKIKCESCQEPPLKKETLTQDSNELRKHMTMAASPIKV